MTAKPVALFAAWLVVIGAGSSLVWRYKLTAAPPLGDAPMVWPSDSALTRSNGRTTLIVFAHPRCPCTSATVAEVGRAIASAENTKLDVIVRFFAPKNAGREWLESPTWSAARLLPAANIGIDEDGREAALFGAGSSGAIVVYDGRGQLVFAGGATIARGHEGDSNARRALVSALEGSTRIFNLPVFGCQIRAKDA